MPTDRLDFVRRAIVLGHDAASGLAQPMRHALLEKAGGVDLSAKPSAERALGERPAWLICQERQGRVGAWTGCERRRQFRRHRALNRHRLALAVFHLREHQPAIFQVPATERDGVATTAGDAKDQFEREPGHGADGMGGAKLRNLFVR
jgi:hypothetical protein